MQLRQACRALQLPTLGNKEALQQRLAGQAIHDDDGGDDDDDADDDDDQEDGGHEGVDGEEGGGGDDVEMDASLAPDTLKWMGECARTIAVVPAHLTYDPLYGKMIDKIIERHKNRFHFDTTSAPGSAGVVTPSVPLQLEVRCDSQPTLEFLPKTANLEVYLTNGCLFLIYTFFFAVDPPMLRGALMTYTAVANFLRCYLTMPKRHSERGQQGLDIPTQGMINKLSMALNGMFTRERDSFKSFLSPDKMTFPGQTDYFADGGKPASKTNPAWKSLVAKHRQDVVRKLHNNALPNAANVKAFERLTELEYQQMVLALLAKGTPRASRNAAALQALFTTLGRSCEMTQSAWKDMGVWCYQSGMQDNLIYSPER